MNRERLILLGSLLALFTLMTGTLLWSQYFTSQEFFLAGTRPTFAEPEDLEPRLPPFRGTDPVRGSADPNAVTIVEFADFTCEYCRLTYQELKKTFATTGIPVRFVWRSFPIKLEDPATLLTASAGYCANQQQKFWEVYDRLFTMINPTREGIVKLATEAKLEVNTFEQCLNGNGPLQAFQADRAIAKDHNITAAPTIFVGSNAFNGFVSADELRQAINFAAQK